MIPEKCVQKTIFPLLFLEQAYLSNWNVCILDILSMPQKRSDLLYCVCGFLFRA